MADGAILLKDRLAALGCGRLGRRLFGSRASASPWAGRAAGSARRGSGRRRAFLSPCCSAANARTTTNTASFFTQPSRRTMRLIYVGLTPLAQPRWLNTRAKIAITLTANQRVSLPFTSRVYGINLPAALLCPSSNPAPTLGTHKYQRDPDRRLPWLCKAASCPMDGGRSEQRLRMEPGLARDEDPRLRSLRGRDIRNIHRLRKVFFRCRRWRRAMEHFGALVADSGGQ